MRARVDRTEKILEALRADTRWWSADEFTGNAILAIGIEDDAQTLAVASMAPEKLLPAAAKSGFEDELVEELRDAAEGRKPKTNTWRLPFGGKNYDSGATSMNWTIMARAVRFALGIPGAREELVNEEFPFQLRWFMGSELFSTCHKYGFMHVGSWALIAKRAHETGDTEVATFADRWLLLWFCVQLMREAAPGEAVLIAGLRSAGHPANQGDLWARWLLALVLGGRGRDLSACEGALKRAGMAPRKSYKAAVGLACAEPMRRACAPLLRGESPSAVAPAEFGSIVPMAIRRTEFGLATWIESNANSNTGPVAASIVDADGSRVGPVRVLPEGGGGRTRRNVVVGLAEDLGRLVGTFDGEPVELALPGGASNFKFRMFPGARSWPADPPPVGRRLEPIEVEVYVAATEELGAQFDQRFVAKQLIRAQDWSAAADFVAGMAVPRKKLGERDALAARLRALA